MIAAANRCGIALTVNWPLAWVPSHRTTKRLIDSGVIGDLQQIHFYDGNRGPLRHDHGKKELTGSTEGKQSSWWYSKAAGGGSMRDYLGYGTTLATWFRDGAVPNAITATWHVPAGLEVDEQAVVVAEYSTGLSVFETRWGTLTDPWTRQPLPRCGFIVGGSEGSIASWDYAETVELHRADGSEPEHVPVDRVQSQDRTALANLIAHLTDGRALDPPMTAEVSRTGHLMVEAAVASAERGARIPFKEVG
jgi:predicted dehydrogenase